MSARDDPFARVRAVFALYVAVPPSDAELTNLVYLLELASKAPVGITHGKAHRDLAAAVRILLQVLPGLIADADDAAMAAHRDGRATDMDHFAGHLRTLLAATEPFRPITARRDRRGAWHGWARMMAMEVRRCGGTPVSFAHETASGVRILAALLGRQRTRSSRHCGRRERKKPGNKFQSSQQTAWELVLPHGAEQHLRQIR
jgi:hypothetical protein